MDSCPHMELLLHGRQLRKAAEMTCTPVRDRYGLRQIEVEILFFLSKAKDATSSDICHALLLNKGHVSQGADSLCQKGYLRMHRSAEDRRCVTFELTDAAIPIVRELDLLHTQLLAHLTQGISPQELALIESVFTRLLHNADTLLESGGPDTAERNSV